jgi:ubiquinone/menaquinone biosynthesis C-methylase UbiE
MKPDEYEAWYETARGRWIAGREFDLMMRLMKPPAGATLLDVGCGTGHISRRFAAAGMRVTGLDPDATMLDYARELGGGVSYLRGTATELPLPDGAYDYVTAVTSLCFIADTSHGLREMWRALGCAGGGPALGAATRTRTTDHDAQRNISARWQRVRAHGRGGAPRHIAVGRVSCGTLAQTGPG